VLEWILEASVFYLSATRVSESQGVGGGDRGRSEILARISVVNGRAERFVDGLWISIPTCFRSCSMSSEWTQNISQTSI
jgi:hypothetical protein